MRWREGVVGGGGEIRVSKEKRGKAVERRRRSEGSGSGGIESDDSTEKGIRRLCREDPEIDPKVLQKRGYKSPTEKRIRKFYREEDP